jgi:hypothetical protein
MCSEPNVRALRGAYGALCRPVIPRSRKIRFFLGHKVGYIVNVDVGDASLEARSLEAQPQTLQAAALDPTDTPVFGELSTQFIQHSHLLLLGHTLSAAQSLYGSSCLWSV